VWERRLYTRRWLKVCVGGAGVMEGWIGEDALEVEDAYRGAGIVDG